MVKIIRNEIDWLSLAFDGNASFAANAVKTRLSKKGKLEFEDPVFPEPFKAVFERTILNETVQKYGFFIGEKRIGRFYRNVSVVKNADGKASNFPNKLDFEGTDLSDPKTRKSIFELAKNLLEKGEVRITKLDYAVDVSGIDPIFFFNRLKSKTKAKMTLNNATKRLESFGTKNSRGAFRCYDKKLELLESGKEDAAPDYEFLAKQEKEVTRLEFRYGSEFLRKRDSKKVFERVESLFLRSIERVVEIDRRKKKKDLLSEMFPKVPNLVKEDDVDNNSSEVVRFKKVRRAEAVVSNAVKTLMDAEILNFYDSEVLDELEKMLHERKFRKNHTIDFS